MVRVPKYHQTRKDRRHESQGMSHHRRKDSRHESEGMSHYKKGYRDGLDSHFMGMISEDRNAPSNLPQVVIHKHYAMKKYIDKYELDDSIYGIDDNMNDSVRMLDAYPSGSMY